MKCNAFFSSASLAFLLLGQLALSFKETREPQILVVGVESLGCMVWEWAQRLGQAFSPCEVIHWVHPVALDSSSSIIYWIRKTWALTTCPVGTQPLTPPLNGTGRCPSLPPRQSSCFSRVLHFCFSVSWELLFSVFFSSQVGQYLDFPFPKNP